MSLGTPYTIVGGSSAPGAGTSLQVSVSASSAAGDAIVVAAGSDTLAETVATITDSQGNSYAPVNSDYNQSTGIAVFAALGARALASGTDWIKASYSGSSGSHTLNGRGCSGVNVIVAVDKFTAGDGASGTAMSSGSTGALSQSSEWALAFSINGNSGGIPSSWTGGFTARDTEHATSNQYQTVADQVVSSAAALTASATIVSAHWAMVLVTLRAAVGTQAPFISQYNGMF
jgi:hypothetical protein